MTDTKSLLDSVLSILPYRLSDEINRVMKKNGIIPEEIRLRAEHRASLTYGNENIMLETVLRKEEIATLTKRFSKDSLYAFRDTIASGYIPFGNGIRIGVAGSAVCDGGRVSSVYNITSLAVRIPREAADSASELCKALTDSDGRIRSCMVFSPSGVGKTTVLRSAACIFAREPNPKRVSVVDTREEIGAFMRGTGLSVDILSGYPKEIGIEIAARTLNAQLIVSDEVFGEKEAMALAGAVNCGVPILCSAHAKTFEELVCRPGIDYLFGMNAFEKYVRIERGREPFTFEYEFFGGK